MATRVHDKNMNEVAIRELVENWASAVRNKNMDAIIAHHSNDIVMYDVPPPFQSVGIAEYRKTWDTFFAFTKRGVFDIQELHIVADEKVAFCFAKMKCEDKSKSIKFESLDFRLTIGLKKINDQWVIVHEHHSVPAI
jgi:ketosteroid isomerase-like protein